MDLIGLEPITSRLQGECSPKDELEAQNFSRCLTGTATFNLYQSLRTVDRGGRRKGIYEYDPFAFGGPRENRTPDLADANGALSHLSYRPETVPRNFAPANWGG